MQPHPSNGYKLGLALAAVAGLALVMFLFIFDVVTVFKGSLITFGVGTLIYYYALPLFAKRPNYIGDIPSKQLVRVNLFPYGIFTTCCVFVAFLAWYIDV